MKIKLTKETANITSPHGVGISVETASTTGRRLRAIHLPRAGLTQLRAGMEEQTWRHAHHTSSYLKEKEVKRKDVQKGYYFTGTVTSQRISFNNSLT